jgi:Ca-activated chloride channel family protein
MLANARRAGLAACLLILAACAASTQTTQGESDEVVVTANGRDASVHPPPPPPPPPPPMVAGEAQMRAYGAVAAAPYAQSSPQPMPGDVDRENYEDFDKRSALRASSQPPSAVNQRGEVK